ncbi:hypothetical protein FSP39_002372 [Pinctada imbricata]|uniref:G-protein coupled receptors family 1 profile domain-containing protein n=1 Tax=Pinctada imbricata TaxID=66713 RepID=A0AA88XCJ0_PINIB|nr:hypothetical protein FSP39_002372 [Pinctada imbricata]
MFLNLTGEFSNITSEANFISSEYMYDTTTNSKDGLNYGDYTIVTKINDTNNFLTTERISNQTTTEKINESIVPPILQFLFGFIGNVTAIGILIWSARRHQWKTFYRFVFALALTDLSGNILVYPIVLIRYASDFTYNFSESECHHISFMYSFAFLGSAMIVSAMSFDRFLAILFPFNYNAPTKNIRTHVLIGACWSVSAIICILPVIGVGKVKLFYPGSWCFIDFASHDSVDRVDTYLYAILGVIIFITTLTLNSAVIIAIGRKIYINRKNLGSYRRLKSDLYIVFFLLAIVIVFSICWVPLMAHMIRNINVPNPGDGKTELLVVRLAISNANIDPWIYIVLRRENLEFLERFTKRCRNTNNNTERSSNLESNS